MHLGGGATSEPLFYEGKYFSSVTQGRTVNHRGLRVGVTRSTFQTVPMLTDRMNPEPQGGPGLGTSRVSQATWLGSLG